MLVNSNMSATLEERTRERNGLGHAVAIKDIRISTLEQQRTDDALKFSKERGKLMKLKEKFGLFVQAAEEEKVKNETTMEDKEKKISKLETELETTKQNLDATKEDLETTKLELKVTKHALESSKQDLAKKASDLEKVRIEKAELEKNIKERSPGPLLNFYKTAADELNVARQTVKEQNLQIASLTEKVPLLNGNLLTVTSGQSYNGSTIVNYDSRGVPD